jgi:hypothetical protein
MNARVDGESAIHPCHPRDPRFHFLKSGRSDASERARMGPGRSRPALACSGVAYGTASRAANSFATAITRRHSGCFCRSVTEAT